MLKIKPNYKETRSERKERLALSKTMVQKVIPNKKKSKLRKIRDED